MRYVLLVLAVLATVPASAVAGERVTKTEAHRHIDRLAESLADEHYPSWDHRVVITQRARDCTRKSATDVRCRLTVRLSRNNGAEVMQCRGHGRRWAPSKTVKRTRVRWRCP